MGIAVTLFVGLTSNATSINNRVNDLYEKSNMADIWVNVSSYDTNDESELKKYGDVFTRNSLSSSIAGRNGKLLLLDEYPTISKPYETDNKDEDSFFIIDERLLEANYEKWVDEDDNYKTVQIDLNISLLIDSLRNTIIPGLGSYSIYDVLNLCKKAEQTYYLFDNKTYSFSSTVTGRMIFPENVESSMVNESSYLMSKSILENSFQKSFYESYVANESIDQNTLSLIYNLISSNYFSINQYLLKVNDSYSIKSVINKINKYYSQKENSNLVMAVDIDHLQSNITIQNDIKQASQLAYVFPLVFFLVGLLVVLTTTSQLILKERIQIGTLKAIGLSKKRILALYSSLTMLVVFIGTIIGIVVGPLILPGVMNKKYAILYTLPKASFTIAIPEAIITLIVCLLTAFLVTFLVIRSELKLQPSESMRPKAITSFKAKRSTTSKSTRLLSLKMALRNIRANLVKSIMVIIGICGCTSLLVCGFGIDDTLDYGIDHDMAMIYDADITFGFGSGYDRVSEINSVEGVKKVSSYASLPTTAYRIDNDLTSSFTTFYAFHKNNGFFNGDNGYQLDSDKIAISQKVRKALNVEVGDNIKFIVLNNSYTKEIGAIFDCFYIHGIFANLDDPSFNDIQDKTYNGWIEVEDGYKVDDVAKRLKEQIPDMSTCFTRKGNRDRINTYMDSISLMTLTVKIFAILLAVVVLYNLTLLNFKERIRDIATMKVLGFTKLEISRSLIFEVMSLTSVGALLGLLLGKPLEILVLFINQTPIVEYMYIVYNVTYVLSFLISFLTALFVNLILTTRIKKVSMVESLKSVE